MHSIAFTSVRQGWRLALAAALASVVLTACGGGSGGGGTAIKPPDVVTPGAPDPAAPASAPQLRCAP